jgi:hypothetical protein
MRKYAIVIEKGENNLSAYVPDLPGCITTGQTTEEIERNIRARIAGGWRADPRATNSGRVYGAARRRLTCQRG